MIRTILILILLTSSSQTLASDEAARKAPLQEIGSQPITIGKTITYRSELLASEVTMNVALPDNFEISSPAHTYPIVFINGSHGEQFFTTLVGIVKHLASRARMPESIVVSLNSGGEIPQVYTNGMWSAETLGGSSDYQKSLLHLEEEVIPYLEQNYRANDLRMIVGVSGSSLFPLVALTKAPELFDSYVLIAAADVIGMGYQPGETFLDALEAAMAKTPSRQAKIYLGVADRDVEKRTDYQDNLVDFRTRFTEFSGLDIKIEVFPREDHYAVFTPAMTAAFDQNYPWERWSPRYRDIVAQPGDALANIDRFYEELSEDSGFTVLPRADCWNNVNCLRFMIRHLIRLDRTAEAVAVAERRAQYRPGVQATLRGLVDAYEANEQWADAVETQERLVRQAKDSGVEDSEPLLERLRSLKENLTE